MDGSRRPPGEQPPAAPERREEEQFVTTEHFSVRFFNGKGREITTDRPSTFTFEYTRYQDVLDLVPYTEQDGEVRIGVVQTKRPAIAVRRERVTAVPEVDTKPPGGLHWETPSAYIRTEAGESSLDRTAERTLARKLPGATIAGKLEILGGSYLPSVGGSTEMVFPRAVKIEPPATETAETQFLTPQEIVDGYFQGTFQDVRLLELALRLAQKKGIDIRLPELPLTRETEKKDLSGIGDRIATRADVRRLASTTADREGVITHITVEPAPAPDHPFISVERSTVDIQDGTGATVDRQIADFVLRKGIDSVDVGAYFWRDGRLYMPIKRGVRPSLAVRNLRPHPVHTDTNPVFIEGIAGSLVNEHTLAEIAATAKRETEEEVGIAPLGEPVFIGADYPSPGHNPERSYRFLMEVDPTQTVSREQGIEETTDVWYVDVDDVLALVDEGLIRDPRLALDARVLKYAFRYRSPDAREPLASPEELEAFQELVNSGSRIQEWLSREALEVDNRLNESVLYRRLKTYCENELGVTAIDLKHPAEAKFFSAMVPVFALPHPDDPRKLPFYFLHDLFHYATGDYLPIKKINPDGSIEFYPKEEYVRACSGNECHAVWYSDMVIPEEFGLDRAEEIFRGHSVARAFLEMGFDRETALAAIRQIELEGVIPPEIVRHPKYGEFRDVIVDRVLKYHVFDQSNIGGVYEHWVARPDVTKVAARFCDAFTDRAAYVQYNEETLDRIRTYTEGLNPLRAALSRAVNVRVRLTALKLGYLKHCVRSSADSGAEATQQEIDGWLDRLAEAQATLSQIRKQVQDIDASPENLQAFRTLREFEAGLFPAAEQYAAALGEHDTLLTPEQRERVRDRILPYFEYFNYPKPDFVAAELARLETESKRRAGIVE